MGEKFEVRKTWRVYRNHKAPPPPMNWTAVPAADVPPTRFFDQVSRLGDEFAGCFVIETTEGLILLDCLYPTARHLKLIEDGLKELELEPKNIKEIFITHGHFDHYGCADYFREKYGARIWMSKTDYEYAKNPPDPEAEGMPPEMEKRPLIPFEIYDFIEDGHTFTMGDTTIHFFATPGHSPGTMSFVFNCTDDGRPHMACLWGGTGTPHTRSAQEQYLRSATYFTEMCDALETDVEISNHPVVDNGLLKLQISREIKNGVANPWVIGREACHRYTNMFYDFCKGKMDRKK